MFTYSNKYTYIKRGIFVLFCEKSGIEFFPLIPKNYEIHSSNIESEAAKHAMEWNLELVTIGISRILIYNLICWQETKRNLITKLE